jgi:hypothetical protein
MQTLANALSRPSILLPRFKPTLYRFCSCESDGRLTIDLELPLNNH